MAASGQPFRTESPLQALKLHPSGADGARAHHPSAARQRRDTEEIVAQELDPFVLDGAPHVAAVPSRERRSYSMAPRPLFAYGAPADVRRGAVSPRAARPGRSLAEQLGVTHREDADEDMDKALSWTSRLREPEVPEADAVAAPTVSVQPARESIPSSRVPPPRIKTPRTKPKRFRSRSFGVGADIARPADFSSSDSDDGMPPVQVAIGSKRAGFSPIYARPAMRREEPPEADDGEGLTPLARNISATSFDDLQLKIQRLQLDMELFDACVICGEFGKCARFHCCKTPRHMQCEMDFAKANRLRWRLAYAKVRPDGSKVFKRLRPARTEEGYHKQLASAGDRLYQLLPCSVCRKPLAAVRAVGEFAPVAWMELDALEEEQEARDEVAMRGDHPARSASGARRLLALAGYAGYGHFARWQCVWCAILVVVTGVCLFIFSTLSREGSAEFGPLLGAAATLGALLVLACWCVNHCMAVSRTKAEMASFDEERDAVASGRAARGSAQPLPALAAANPLHADGAGARAPKISAPDRAALRSGRDASSLA